MPRANPAISRLHELLAYDANTGEITWKVLGSPTAIPGSIAGSKTQDGYIKIVVDGTCRVAHRIAWAMHHGEWPKGAIDHANGVRVDNRIANLRLSNKSQNAWNSRYSRGSEKLRGVVRVNDEKFYGRIRIAGKLVQLGTFSTPEAAHAAYRKASMSTHGEFSPYVEAKDAQP